MPIYEYACARCGGEREEIRDRGEADREGTCGTCGAPTTRKLSSFATPGLGRPKSRIVRDDSMKALLPYFAARD